MKLNLIITEHKKVKRLDVGYGDSPLEKIIYDPPKFVSEISLPIEPRVLHCTFEDNSLKTLRREDFNLYFNRKEVKPEPNYNYEANLKVVSEFLERNHMIYLLHREVDHLIIPVTMAARTIEGKGRTLLEFIKEVPSSGVITDKNPHGDKGFYLKFTDGCFVSYFHRKPYWDRFNFDVVPKSDKIVTKEIVRKEIVEDVFEIEFTKQSPFRWRYYLKDYLKCNKKISKVRLKGLVGGDKLITNQDWERFSVPFYQKEIEVTFSNGKIYCIDFYENKIFLKSGR